MSTYYDLGRVVGKGFVIKGFFTTADELSSECTAPEAGDAYAVGLAAPYNIYIWDGIGLQWVNSGPLSMSMNAFILNLPRSGWVDKGQSVASSYVTVGDMLLMSPAPTCQSVYTDCGVHCTAQLNGELSFACTNIPEQDISVIVLAL